MFSWRAFLIYLVATGFTPGPNTLSSLANGTRLGFRKSLPYMVGIWWGLSIVAVVCTALCSTLEALIPRIRTPMLVLGACYILYLAWKTWHAGAISEMAAARSSFRDGFLLQFVNVKVFLYCIVAMQSYVLPYYQGQYGTLMLMALVMAFVAFLMNLCWAGFGSALKVLFSRYAAIINRILALLLVWCAVRLFL